MFDRDGKTYVEVTDYPKMKQGVGMLLAELMRIKAEGDYAAIKALVDKYGVHFDPKLRDQVVERYKVLDIPVYWVGVNAQLNAKSAGGKAMSVDMLYPRNAVHQFLYYGSMYCKDVKVPTPSQAASHSAALRGDKVHLLIGAFAVERLVQAYGLAGGVDSNRSKAVDDGQHDVGEAEGPH